MGMFVCICRPAEAEVLWPDSEWLLHAPDCAHRRQGPDRAVPAPSANTTRHGTLTRGSSQPSYWHFHGGFTFMVYHSWGFHNFLLCNVFYFLCLILPSSCSSLCVQSSDVRRRLSSEIAGLAAGLAAGVPALTPGSTTPCSVDTGFSEQRLDTTPSSMGGPYTPGSSASSQGGGTPYTPRSVSQDSGYAVARSVLGNKHPA